MTTPLGSIVLYSQVRSNGRENFESDVKVVLTSTAVLIFVFKEAELDILIEVSFPVVIRMSNVSEAAG
jgi:hypothetical protein